MIRMNNWDLGKGDEEREWGQGNEKKIKRDVNNLYGNTFFGNK